ncbi:hypothetical protein [Halobacteriovorax sp. CON-3]|uniref:hypothetical protein n=1 Tax=Halobacteriovorax sp. CON-3 TaxID=3157710 RepID=UPI0037184F25
MISKILSLYLLSSPLVYAEKVYSLFPKPVALPTKASVKIIDSRIGLSTRQVCGYNDWSSIQAYIPAELATGKHWEGVGAKAVATMKDTATNVFIGSTDQYLMNVSPSAYAVMDKYQRMGYMQYTLDKDDCKTMESLIDSTGLANSPLTQCIKNRPPGMSFSQAKTACQNRVNSDLKKRAGMEERLSNVEEKNKILKTEEPTLEKFISIIFGDVQSSGTTKKDGKKVNRGEIVRKFSYEIISGITLKGTTIIAQHNNVRASLSNSFFKSREETKDALYIVLNEASKLLDKGFGDEKINGIINNKYFNPEGDSYFIGQKLSYIGETKDEITPLIEAEYIVSLAKMNTSNDEDFFKKKGTRANGVVGRLASLRSYIEGEETLLAIKSETENKCMFDPRLQSREYQINCKGLINIINTSRERLLSEKRMSENLFKAKQRVADIALRSQKNEVNGVLIDNFMKKDGK